MPTSSILKQVSINDPEKVKRFIEAMEEAREWADSNVREKIKYTQLNKEQVKEYFKEEPK